MMKQKNLPPTGLPTAQSRPYNRQNPEKTFPSQGATNGQFGRARRFSNQEILAKERVLLRAIEALAESLISSGQKQKVNYKINLIPVNGSSTVFIHDSLIPADMLGIKIIPLDNGDAVAYFRVKSRASEVEKRSFELGGAPFLQATAHHVSTNQALDSCQRALRLLGTEYDLMKGKPGQAEAEMTNLAEARENITLLIAILRADGIARENLLRTICGTNLEYERVQEIASKANMGWLIEGMSKLREETRKKLEQVDSRFTVKGVVGAAMLYPSEIFSGRMGVGEKDRVSFPSGWAESYALEVLQKCIGVDRLEHTTQDSIMNLEKLLELSYVKSDKKERFSEKVEKIQGKFALIISLVNNVDAQLDKMRLWAHGDSELWWGKVCEITAKRKKILVTLLELDDLARTISHEKHVQNQIRLTLANMAVNLCRIDREEIDKWELLLSVAGKGKKNRVKSEQIRQVKRFIEAGRLENQFLQSLLADITERTSAFKAERSRLNEKIIKSIGSLREISPQVADRVLELYQRTLDHVEYKQGAGLSPYLLDAHFPRARLLFMLKHGMPENISEERYGRDMKEAIRQNAQIYGIICKNPALCREILGDINALLHVQGKAFDLASDYSGLSKSKYAHVELNVRYSFSTEALPDGTCAEMLSLYPDLNGAKEIKIPLSSDPQDFDSHLPPAASFAGAISPEEELYGRKIMLCELIDFTPDYDSASVQRIYETIGERAISESATDDYRRIKAQLSSFDAGTAHALSTLVNSEPMGGAVTTSLGRNSPLQLKSENTLESGLRAKYPNYGAERAEVDAYVRHKLIRRIFNWMNANIPYYVEKYARLSRETAQGAYEKNGDRV